VAGTACIVSNKKTGHVDWVCFSGLSAELQSNYIHHYAPLDPFSPLLNVNVGWLKLSESLSDTILRRNEWYNDFVLSCGVRDILGASLVETSSHVGIFGLHQQLGRRFADDTAAVMEMVAAPLSVAMVWHFDRLFRSKARDAETDILYWNDILLPRDERQEVSRRNR
jgi:hypothetical protein